VRIQIIDPTADSRWDDFLAGQKNSTVFHTSAWARVLRDTYGYKPRYYVLENEAGQFRAAIPFFLVRSLLTGKRLVCLPFSDYCSPLGDDVTDIVLLLDSAKKEVDAGTASFLEIKGWQNGVIPAQLSLATRDYNILYTLNLEQGADILKKRLDDGIKDSLRQASKRGVTVRMTNREEDMDYFYMLHVATRKKLGVLPQPHAFFKALFRHMISQHLGFITIGVWEKKTIAASIFLSNKDTIYFKFSSSDERYLKKRPNHPVIWETIRYACAEHYKYFDFGRCTPEEEGLREFKSRWGAKEVALPYYYYPDVKGFTAVSENSAKHMAMRFFSHIMPQFAFKAAGSLLYKHLG
jgi:CelD/BcsL family acetyltransferase involved in cellulose biosynthesis